MAKLVIRRATVADISSIVQASLESTTQEETRGFAAPEWVTYSSPEELKKVWAEGNRFEGWL